MKSEVKRMDLFGPALTLGVLTCAFLVQGIPHLKDMEKPQPLIGIVSDIVNCYRYTDEAEKCHFPFTYLGGQFTNCTKAGLNPKDNRVWCSLTADYDKDKKWSYCQPNYCDKGCKVRTIWGQTCRLPFEYKKKEYNYCTKENHDALWCYDERGTWGECDVTNCGNCTVKTTKWESCVFPFYYKGKWYDYCARVKKNSRPWCALDQYFIKKRWGYCEYTTCV